MQKAAHGARTDAAGGQAMTASTSGAEMANELILIVEDDDKSRKLVRDLLVFNGYQTVEAVNGLDGVRLARERLPVLVLMDIQLPDISGIEARERIRTDAATRHIPVIAVTASVMPEDRQRVVDAGFDGYQRKPISMKEFLAAVRQVIDQRAGKAVQT
jgi:two-component system, cell cycle response regulator DivK